MSNVLSYIACFGWLIPFLFGLLGLLLGWLLFRGKKQVGDLSVEGEGALRAEADSLRARVQELEGRVSTRDGEVSDLKGKLAAAAAGAAVAGGAAAPAKGDDDETYALEWRNRYLAARVKYLEGRVAEAPKKAAPKKRAAAKKAAPKKKVAPKKKAAPKAKVTTAKKKPGPKPGTKRSALTAAGKPRKKPGPKAGSTRKAKPKMTEAEAKFEKYYANVKKYHKSAKRDVVQNIVKYCGIALRSRDGSLVACSQEHEVETVAKGFATKKLGLKSGQTELVKDICKQMKSERFKSRVTFYYLAAKKAGKLDVFGG